MESASMGQGRPIIAGPRSLLRDSARPPGNIRIRCRQFLPSGIESAFFQSERYGIDRKHIRGDPVVDTVSFRVTHHFLKASLDNILQTLVDFPFAPEISLAVLDPPKIAPRHAAGIGEDVRNDEDVFAIDDLVSHRRARTVCAFAKDASL